MMGQPKLHPTAQAMMTQGRGGMHQPMQRRPQQGPRPLAPNAHGPAHQKPAPAPQPQVVGIPVPVQRPVPVPLPMRPGPVLPPALLQLLLQQQRPQILAPRPIYPWGLR